MSQLFSADDQRRHALFNGPQIDPTAHAAQHGYAYTSRRQHAGKPLMPDDFMPIGPHAGKHLRAIDPWYYAWVQHQAWAARWADWKPVADFLDRFPQFLPPPMPAENKQPLPIASPCFYVDALRPAEKTKAWPWDARARLFTDPGDLDWLHTFAAGALGLRRGWFYDQHRGAPAAADTIPHYPLSPAKHARALQFAQVQLVDAAALSHHTRRWSTQIGRRPEGSADTPVRPAASRRTPFQRLSPQSSQWCRTTKPGYSKKEAETLLNQRMHRSGERNRPDFLRIYHCPDCNQWHLTRKQVS